jgi:hypothetical protein
MLAILAPWPGSSASFVGSAGPPASSSGARSAAGALAEPRVRPGGSSTGEHAAASHASKGRPRTDGLRDRVARELREEDDRNAPGTITPSRPNLVFGQRLG